MNKYNNLIQPIHLKRLQNSQFCPYHETYNGAKVAEHQVSQTIVSKGETSVARLGRVDGSDRLRSGVQLGEM